MKVLIVGIVAILGIIFMTIYAIKKISKPM